MSLSIDERTLSDLRADCKVHYCRSRYFSRNACRKATGAGVTAGNPTVAAFPIGSADQQALECRPHVGGDRRRPLARALDEDMDEVAFRARLVLAGAEKADLVAHR